MVTETISLTVNVEAPADMEAWASVVPWPYRLGYTYRIYVFAFLKPYAGAEDLISCPYPTVTVKIDGELYKRLTGDALGWAGCDWTPTEARAYTIDLEVKR